MTIAQYISPGSAEALDVILSCPDVRLSLCLIPRQVTTPDDLGAATIEVLMPAGLEPLDPNLVPGLGASCGLQAMQPRSMFWWWWWPVCPAQETRPSAVTFRYARLQAGSSSVQLSAVAVTAGVFVLPPIKASADMQPEVMGMTAAGHLTVCSGSDCVPEASGEATVAPVACRNDCSGGNGVCRLDIGKCVCAAAFAGEDCSEVVI